MFKKLIFIAIVFFAMLSCKKETFDPGVTTAVKVANEWWVNLYLDGAPQLGGFVKMDTYNVAANNDSIWVDDFGNIWDFKCRAKFDATNLSFLATNSVNEKYKMKDGSPMTITITDTKIMLNKAKSATGVVTDSIYFKIEFLDDPGTIYEIKGTGRTKWAEDDY